MAIRSNALRARTILLLLLAVMGVLVADNNARAATGRPSVTKVVPSGGPTKGGTTVTITGSNLDTATAVLFGTTSLGTTLKVVSNTEVTVTAPTHPAGIVKVVVTTPRGTSPTSTASAVAPHEELVDEYAYYGPPSVSNVTPDSGPTKGGTKVTITGSGFLPDTTVLFGTIYAAATVRSPTALSVTSPEVPGPGRYRLSVSTPFGTSNTRTFDFLPTRPPTITTTTSLTTTPANSQEIGKNVRLEAAVTPPAARGTIEFNAGSTLLGTKTLSGGLAELTVSSLAVGTYSLSAVFMPSSIDYTGSTGRTSLTVKSRLTIRGKVVLHTIPKKGPPGSFFRLIADEHNVSCPILFVSLADQFVGEGTPTRNGSLVLGDLRVPGNTPSGIQTLSLSCSSAGVPVIAKSQFLVEDSALHAVPFETSVVPPGGIEFSAPSILLALLSSGVFLFLALVVAAGFPSEFFNEMLMNRRARQRSRCARLIGFVVLITVGGLLTALLEPGLQLSLSYMWFVIGAALAIAVLAVISSAGDALTGLRLRRDRDVKVLMQVIFRSIPIAVICVLLSRLCHFQPGYMYGLVAGFAVVSLATPRDVMTPNQEGAASGLSMTILLFASVGAWAFLGTVSHEAANNSAVGWHLLEAFLSVLYVAGLETTAFALFPLPMMMGKKVFRWNPLVWGLLFVTAWFAFVKFIAIPHWLTWEQGAQSLTPVIVPFLGFMIITVALFFYGRRHTPSQSAPERAPG